MWFKGYRNKNKKITIVKLSDPVPGGAPFQHIYAEDADHAIEIYKENEIYAQHLHRVLCWQCSERPASDDYLFEDKDKHGIHDI
jgi:hypothetical protein